MTSCVHLESVEDLVLGTLAADRAEELRAHLHHCDHCALARSMFEEERELFARRAEVADVVAPPPQLTFPAPARPRHVAQLASLGKLARRAMRSQALPALAAAFFLFAGVSRLGTSTSRTSATPESSVASEADQDLRGGVNATMRPAEPLSCATDDTNAACLANVSASAIANGAGESSTCDGDGVAMSRALSSMCELSVTSWSSRQ